MSTAAKLREARADALLSRITGTYGVPTVEELPDWLDGWTKAEVTRAVDDLLEAGRVRAEGRHGRVELYPVETDEAPA